MVESTRGGTVSCRAESAQGPSQNGLYIFKSLLVWVHLSFPSIHQRPPDGWETIRWKDFWSPKDFVVYAPDPQLTFYWDMAVLSHFQLCPSLCDPMD